MILLYDGECGFCRKWVAVVQSAVNGYVQFYPYQDKYSEYSYLNESDLRKKVHLIDGKMVWVGAEAIYKVIALSKRWPWSCLGRLILWMYNNVLGFNRLSEWGYGWVASHRSWVSSFLFPPFFNRSVSFFFKGLGLIYCLAFGSLLSQVQGLFGSYGILPISSVMRYVQQFGLSVGQLPTVFWMSYSDTMIMAVPILGVCCGVMMMVSSRYLRLWSLLAWGLYLSIVTVGQAFMSFQWDVLLLEVGFLALLFNPCHPSRWIRFLVQWLLFRVLFASGMVKLMSGDLSWRGLTALNYHYWTQPLPHIGSWWVHQFAPLFHQISMVVMFVIELIIPWFIFGGRRLKMGAFVGINVLMVSVILTGNYGFFNVLVMVMTLLLLDDLSWRWFKYSPPNPLSITNVTKRGRNMLYVYKVGVIGISVVIILLSFPADLNRFLSPNYQITFLRPLFNYVQPFRIVNGYGLFAVMTKTRPELIVQGSDDGVSWKEYMFKWKTNEVFRRPQWAFPYHPRLDWQLWFAGLGTFEGNRWLLGLLRGLSMNHPHVLGLLHHNPFSDHVPSYLRIMKSNYTFTTVAQWRKTGRWWVSGDVVPYSPVFKLNP